MNKIRNTRVLTSCAMLVAIAILLGFFKIPVTSLIEIRFGSIPVAVSGALFGPFCSSLVGALADIGGYLVRPTGPFFPGFTISSAITGLIFGVFLYRKKITLARVAAAQTVNTLVTGILLNTLWLSMLYGMPLKAVFFSRLPKECIMCVINTLIMMAVIRPVCSISVMTRREAAE